ncbi:MAG: TIGR03086 family metal-binding protein [Mycobacteriales bacterium]
MTKTPLDLLDPSLDAVGVLIHRIRTDGWSAPTPCDTWAVRDVVTHLAGMNRVFTAMLTDSPLPERAPISDDALPSVYRSSSLGLLRAFAQPGVLERTYESPMGTTTGMERLSIRLYDLIAHGWDLARATGQAPDFPDDATAHALQFARKQIGGAGIPGRFAPAQQVAADAPPVDRLAAHLGRRVT